MWPSNSLLVSPTKLDKQTLKMIRWFRIDLALKFYMGRFFWLSHRKREKQNITRMVRIENTSSWEKGLNCLEKKSSGGSVH